MLNILSVFKPKAEPVRRPERVRAAPPRTEAEWAAQRSPQRDQDLMLADHVLAWLRELPQPLRPSALCARYPRVANRIALCWSDPALTEQLFASLLFSERTKRRGFPPPVAGELVNLREFHARRKGIYTAPEIWDRSLLAVSDR